MQYRLTGRLMRCGGLYDDRHPDQIFNIMIIISIMHIIITITILKIILPQVGTMGGVLHLGTLESKDHTLQVDQDHEYEMIHKKK